MWCISDTTQSISTQWLSTLSHIPPLHLRRQQALLKEAHKIASIPDLLAHQEFMYPQSLRLKSRWPPNQTAHCLMVKPFNLEEKWNIEWRSNPPNAAALNYDPTRKWSI
ncbi:unnamed protein product [Diatraea saccharalis]|uniref:Uncharacterized protein n=1 Tax=Diatraea saccharalis TaxID=40085 RepID=A0A9N9QY51_9NEOP|nr:unnamed protein product [Diatraea saccharalis]